MTYATAGEMETRFGREELEFIARGASTGTLDNDKITAAIDDATSEMNSYFAQRYTVPLVSTPSIVTSACCDIARYRLYSASAPEEVEKRYRSRIEWLKSISKGMATLGVAESTAKESVVSVYTTRSREDRVFTNETLQDF